MRILKEIDKDGTLTLFLTPTELGDEELIEDIKKNKENVKALIGFNKTNSILAITIKIVEGEDCAEK